MRLHVRHQTSYRYDVPVAGAIQTLRLTPRSYEGLRIVQWRVWSDTRRELPVFVDGYGNLTHCHAVKDYVSRDLFEKLMHDEEEHIDFLETQLKLVDDLGLQLYAQHHIGELHEE